MAQQMNAIEKLQEDVRVTEGEMRDVRMEFIRRQELLHTAREELGRMLRAMPHLENSSYRVVHECEFEPGQPNRAAVKVDG